MIYASLQTKAQYLRHNLTSYPAIYQVLGNNESQSYCEYISIYQNSLVCGVCNHGNDVCSKLGLEDMYT